MTFKTTSKHLRACGFAAVFFLFTCASLLANDPCLIRTDIEPDVQQSVFVSTNVYSGTKSDLEEWLSPSSAVGQDGQLASVKLEPGAKSNQLIFSDFYFDVPLGAKITGIQVELTGSSTNPYEVEEEQMQFLLDGSPIGNNLAKKTIFSYTWGESQHTWQYGYNFSDWGMDPTYELLNGNGLSFAMQIENDSDDDSLELMIDHAEVIVYYEPLYTLCGDECVVIYNDEVDDAITYNWTMPDGVKFTNIDQNSRVINLDFNEADYGILEVGLEIIRATDTLYCTREILREHCGPASLGDYVWFDANYNGLQDVDEEGVEGIELSLYNPLDELVATATTDINGFYQFTNLDRGYYYVELGSGDFVMTKQVADDELNSDFQDNFQTEVFYVSGGDSITTLDAGLFASSSIAGMFWMECDGNGFMASDEKVMGALVVELYRGNVKIAETETHGDGSYIFEDLVAGEYTVRLAEASVMSMMTDENLFSGNGEAVVDLAIGEDKTDVNGALNPLSTYDISLFLDEDGDNEYDSGEDQLEGQLVNLVTGTTVLSAEVENGKLSFSDLAYGEYTLEFDNPSAYSVTESSVDFTDGNSFVFELGIPDCNATNEVDIVLAEVDAFIGDFVWFDLDKDGFQDANEPGIVGTVVKLIDFTTASMVDQVKTDANGYYGFEKPEPGNYIIYVGMDDGYKETINDVDPEKGSKVQTVGGNFVMGPVNVTNGYVDENWDAGFVPNPGMIRGTAWLDLDGDNVISSADEFLKDVEVTVFDQDGTEIESKKTTIEGKYEFVVPKGNYYVTFKEATYTTLVDANVGSDPLIDSDVASDANFSTDVFSVGGGALVEGVNIGFAFSQVRVGDQVFLDKNENGLFDDDEIGLKNVEVVAYDASGVEIASTMTGEGGTYELSLDPGDYYLAFNHPGYDQPTIYNTSDEDKNSDITGDFGALTTSLFSLTVGQDRDDIDAGFLAAPIVIGDLVWNDYNSNALFEATETGISDLVVNLIKEGEGIVQTTTTGNGLDTFVGVYNFIVYEPGNYYVQFEIEDNGFNFTQYDPQGSSSVTTDNGFGTTPTFYAEAGGFYKDKDAGVVSPFANVGNYIWNDANGNGLQDADEEGINGVTVFLYDDQFNFIDVTLSTYNPISKTDGHYHFKELDEGKYIVVFDTPEKFSSSYAGGDNTIDSDVTSEFVQGSTSIIKLDEGEKEIHIDAGIVLNSTNVLSTIGDFVWNDENKNGVQDSDELGMSDVELNLLDEFGNLVQSTKSAADGSYEFEDVTKGFYRINVPFIPDFDFTTANNSFDNLTDSDVQSDGNTLLFYVDASQNLDHIDVGMVLLDGIVKDNENPDFVVDENGTETEIEDSSETTFTTVDENNNATEESNQVDNSNKAVQLISALEVYPVPARENIYLKINRELQDLAKIELISAEGQVLHTSFRENAKDLEHEFEVGNFRPGMYFVRVTDGKDVYFKKFVIQ